MVWQDTIISVSLILMSYALIPQVVQNFRKKRCSINLQTATITSVTLFAMAIAFFSLKLYFSATLDVMIGSLWIILLVQSVAYK